MVVVIVAVVVAVVAVVAVVGGFSVACIKGTSLKALTVTAHPKPFKHQKHSRIHRNLT